MRKSLSGIHIIIAIIAILAGNGLKGQAIPEMVPYSLMPIDYSPDSNLELGIAILPPFQVDNMKYNIQKDETYEVIYERINFETINPNHASQIFEVDGKTYVLVRIPYTGSMDNWYTRAMRHSE